MSTDKNPQRRVKGDEERHAAVSLRAPGADRTLAAQERAPPSPPSRALGHGDLPARALYRCWGPWPAGCAPPSPAAPPPGPWGPAATRPPAALRTLRRRGPSPGRGRSPPGPPGGRVRPRRRGSRPPRSRPAPSWPWALGPRRPAAPLIGSAPAPPRPARRRARPSPPDPWLGARRPALRVRGKQLNAPDYLASCLISGTQRVGYFGSFTWACL